MRAWFIWKRTRNIEWCTGQADGSPLAVNPQATALKEAAKAGNVEAIHALLEEGVCVDVVDSQGYTPLYCATMYAKSQAVAVLLAAGAEVDKENNNGISPLMAASRDGYTAIVTHLLEAGADFRQVQNSRPLGMATPHPI